MKVSILKASALAAALWACGHDASAMTYIMPEDRSLLAQSDGVLVGVVKGVPVAAPKRGLPHVRYTLIVERVLAGTLRRAEVQLDLPGTPANAKVRAYIPGIPRLPAGQRVLVFFDRESDAVVVPRDLSLGVFFESSNGLGKSTYDRRLDDAFDMSKGANASREPSREAARFEQWIRRSAAGATPKPDYFTDSTMKFSIAPSGFPDMLPARWFEFDTNTTVSWRAVAAGMTGATFDEFAAVLSAMNAWTNDPGSRILYVNGGTVASDTGNDGTNGINAVIWDDPGADISGAYNCAGGGVLAIGGSFASSNTGVLNGAVYHRNVEGFVITQDNAACAFNDNGGADGAEILGHELGHTLGFGHSCTGGSCVPGPFDDALMRSFIHGDGRGALLGSDDQMAAAFVYPDPNAGANVRIFQHGFENPP